jgi:hypothetical protein
MANNAARINRDIERVHRTLTALPHRTVVELVRRAGKRESSIRSGDRVSVSRGSHNDPTGDAVARRLDSKHLESDAVYEAIQSMALNLRTMADLAVLVDQSARFVLDVQERTKEAQIVRCEACGREVANTPSDRLRSGYCPRHYMAWLRAGKPYRLSFEIEVRNSLDPAH